MSELAGWTCEPWAVDSSTAAALSSQLFHQADAVDQVASRMMTEAALDWESPAGHNFGDYVLVQVGRVRLAGEQLRDAAAQVGAFATSLRSVEYDRFLTQPARDPG